MPERREFSFKPRVVYPVFNIPIEYVALCHGFILHWLILAFAGTGFSIYKKASPSSFA